MCAVSYVVSEQAGISVGDSWKNWKLCTITCFLMSLLNVQHLCLSIFISLLVVVKIEKCRMLHYSYTQLMFSSWSDFCCHLIRSRFKGLVEG